MPMLTRRHFIAAAGVALALPQPADAARAPGPRRTRWCSTTRAGSIRCRSRATPCCAQTSDDALIAALRALLREAAADGRPLCVGGARHSMGGQSLMRDGVAASLAAPLVEPDTARKIMRVRAGTRWRDVIAALDPLGFSPR